MSLFRKFMIITTLVISITDFVVFYHIKGHPEKITRRFVIQVIVITLIPLAINYRYHLFRK